MGCTDVDNATVLCTGVQARVTELEVQHTSYKLALNRAERDQAADRDTIAALRSAVARLRAEVRTVALENETSQLRLRAAMEEQKHRAMEVVRQSEQSRGQLVSDRAAAEHDRDKVLLSVTIHESGRQQRRHAQVAASTNNSKVAWEVWLPVCKM